MSTITRRNAYRYAGVVEAAYLIDGMTVEIIADGIHPVSYTHLDVYKRQALIYAGIWTLSIHGLGKFTKTGSSLLIM